MSENSTPEERTELPTDRRMNRLRSEGALALSNDVVQVCSLISGFMILGWLWTRLWNDMQVTMLKSFALLGNPEILKIEDYRNGFLALVKLWLPDILIINLTVVAAAALATFLQTNWNIKEKKINFRWDMLNPITGIKRIFSINGLVSTGKALLKLTMILPIGYFALKAAAPSMISLIHLSIEQLLVFLGQQSSTLFWKIMYILIGFSIFDWSWTRYQWLRTNKMTKPEVKDERKAVEGDEETKKKIQAKGLQRIMQRLRQTVPKADVVVTNPTHYAVALRYDRENMDAPVVVAKGKDYLALRIRELAKEHGVPVLERKTLARALFHSVEIGAIIPRDLYRAVAEVLAYVYKLKSPWRAQQAQTGGGR